MSFQAQTLISVYYHGSGSKELMGRLFWHDRRIFFEYDPAFIKKGLELSPFKLPLQTGAIASLDRCFAGLFGVFNDSLPDGWGRLLLDRRLMHQGVHPATVSALDRLCFVGMSGMGALSYEPNNPTLNAHLTHDLDSIEDEIRLTLDEQDTYIEDLLCLGGSSAGARPKVLLQRDGQDWLIKFRSSLDPQDMGAIEYAYHQMAVEAGLILPQARLFSSRKGSGFFGVQRFDKQGDRRIHMHTVAGLLHADHREPCLDYKSIMQVTLSLTKDIRQCAIQLRNALFNLLTHNRDDHSKNFSFLMDHKGQWTVSPAYDLTFSAGLSGEHTTMFMGEGKNPTKKHFLALAASSQIAQNQALEIIDEVLSATQKWETFANQAGVSPLQTNNIRQVLHQISQRFHMV